jgi:hypothetical protein
MAGHQEFVEFLANSLHETTVCDNETCFSRKEGLELNNVVPALINRTVSRA